MDNTLFCEICVIWFDMSYKSRVNCQKDKFQNQAHQPTNKKTATKYKDMMCHICQFVKSVANTPPDVHFWYLDYIRLGQVHD